MAASKRLRESALTESVTETQLPQLVRGQDEDDEKRRRRAKAAKPRKAKKAKKRTTRESVTFRAELREADVRRAGTKAYSCVLLREGPGNPGDRRYYSKQALRKAVADGMFEGLQAYANHPTASEERERPERDVRQLVGHFREARYVDGKPAEVRAKFVPIDGAGYEWVVSLIESALAAPKDRPLVGLSIDGHGHVDGETEIGGRRYEVVREIAHLGSVDLVTRAGAGGQFIGRLRESMAGATASAGDPPKLTAKALQKRVRRGLRRLESGLQAEDVETVTEALVVLQEAAGASVKRPANVKPGKAKPANTAKLTEATQREQTRRKDAEQQLKKERKRRRLAETRAAELDGATLAGRLLREANVPPRTAELWHEELAAQRNEQAMRALLERRQAERREQLSEVRESLGLDRVEGVPRRDPLGPSPAPASNLLDKLGIDPEEIR